MVMPADEPLAKTDPNPPKPPLGLLGWIAGYKLLKALIVLVAGIGTWKLRHHDLTRIAMRCVRYFDLDPKGRLVTDLLAHLLRMDDRRLQLLGIGFFVYAVLYTVEGVGLFLEKRWAEWLTVLQTCLLVPLEAFELGRRPTWTRLLILFVNLSMIGYLFFRLQRDRPKPRDLGAGPANPAGPQQQKRD